MVSRLRLLFAIAAALLGASAASSAPRDGEVMQAVVNTAGVHLSNRGIGTSDPLFDQTIAALKAQVGTSTAAGAAPPNPVVAEADRTWQHTLRGLTDILPWPSQIGITGKGITLVHKFPDGRFCWALAATDASTGLNIGCVTATSQLPATCATAGVDKYACPAETINGKHEVNCADVNLRLDASGNLVIPAMPLRPGGPMEFDGELFFNSGFEAGYQQSGSQHIITANNMHAFALRSTHLANMGRAKPDWYGALRESSANCVVVASVSRRNEAGQVTWRQEQNVCSQWAIYQNQSGMAGVHPTDLPCPNSAASGSADYYGFNDAGGHPHSCITYLPNPALGFQGYAMNKETSILFTAQWPNDLPPHLKKCALDPEFLRKLTDALLKKASEQPGYNGAPYKAVEPNEARPGSTNVDDLGDNPTTGSQPNPGPGMNDPPPATPPAGGGGSAPPGTWDNPNTPAPADGSLAAPTGIMDPIFNWLPDLPSITLNTQGAQCPTWNIDLREFLGATAQFTINSHCALVESIQAQLSALMLALFGIGAALIILRA